MLVISYACCTKIVQYNIITVIDGHLFLRKTELWSLKVCKNITKIMEGHGQNNDVSFQYGMWLEFRLLP